MSSKILTGTVISNKMLNTLMVSVERSKSHKRYGKTFKTSKKYKVHYVGGNEVNEGQMVEIRQCSPKSKDKTWELVVEQKK